MLNKMISLNQKKHMLIGASLIRIAFALIILYNYTINYFQRYFLWGADGVIGFSKISIENTPLAGFSLYNFSTTNLYFDVIYHLGIIVALAFLFGYKGKVISILNFIFVWSLMTRNHLILDGGDNISRILLVYLILVNTTAYFSIDAYLKGKSGKGKNENENTVASTNFSLRNLVHNLAVLACLVQVSIVYITSGLHKAMGELWQSGTALYYILQVEEFSHPFFRDLILSSDVILVFGAYMAVFVQLAFPFLVFNRYTKYIGMAGIICMHLGIAVVMGLFSFSFIMIANQLLFLSDKEYTTLHAFVSQKYARIRKIFRIEGKKSLVLEGDDLQ